MTRLTWLQLFVRLFNSYEIIMKIHEMCELLIHLLMLAANSFESTKQTLNTF